MSAVSTTTRSAPVLLDWDESGSTSKSKAEPIVAAVDGSASSRTAVDDAIRLGNELDAPVSFVYVRRGPAEILGAPVYQLRLTSKMARARRVLDRALHAAERAGVDAEGEILEGSPRERILEFSRDRGAQLIVVGSRRRRLGRSVSRGFVRAAERPVVVAPPREDEVAEADER